jgi:hypothetical protein
MAVYWQSINQIAATLAFNGKLKPSMAGPRSLPQAEIEAAGSVKARNNGRELHIPGAAAGSGASPTAATDDLPVADGAST